MPGARSLALCIDLTTKSNETPQILINVSIGRLKWPMLISCLGALPGWFVSSGLFDTGHFLRQAQGKVSRVAAAAATTTTKTVEDVDDDH